MKVKAKLNPDGATEDLRTALTMLLRQSLAIFPLFIGTSIVAAFIVWSRHGNEAVWLWLMCTALFMITRYTKTEKNLERLPFIDCLGLRKLETHQAAMVGITGGLWSMLIWLAPVEDPYIGFSLGGMWMAMVGSAVYSMASSRKVFSAYSLTTMLPVIAKALHVGSTPYLLGAAGATLFLLLVLGNHRRAYSATMATIRLTRENRELVALLTAEKHAAVDASHSKSLFLSGVSHDLKHPLHALRLYLGYLKALSSGQNSAEGLQRALTGMDASLAGMSKLLAQLLDLSRLEAGELRPCLVSVDIQSVFADCASRFQEQARAKGLRIGFMPTGMTLVTDPSMLQSILDNLVSNAVRYTQRGGVVVGARRGGAFPRIEVWDSGIGIVPDNLANIFEAYRRFDDSRQSGEEGHGLGLALVKKQCDLLGMTVTARSRPGCGSVFAVIVPAGRGEA